MHISPKGFDKIYCSIIFNTTKDFLKIDSDNIDYGGSGIDIYKNLPDVIENQVPDYSIYPENDTSYGFISRGCIRNCYFCIVPKKEGKIRYVNHPKDIIFHKKVKFLDNNFLALDNHKELLLYLIKNNIRCQFNQGLDIRLVDKENSFLLSKLNYIGEYIFAFDDIKYKKNIEEKLKLLSWAKQYRLKFFVYVNPKMEIKDTKDRILFLKENKCLPYIMRDISCYNSEEKDFYTDIASWCNQPSLFKNMEFQDFMAKRSKNKSRIYESIKKWENG